MYVSHVLVSACGEQKRISDPLELELQVIIGSSVCVCWEPNLGSLKEQRFLLITDLSLLAQEPKFLTASDRQP